MVPKSTCSLFFYVLSKDELCKKCSQIQFVEMIWMFVWGFILLICSEENFSISYLSLTFCVSHSNFLTHTLSLSLPIYLSIYLSISNSIHPSIHLSTQMWSTDLYKDGGRDEVGYRSAPHLKTLWYDWFAAGGNPAVLPVPGGARPQPSPRQRHPRQDQGVRRQTQVDRYRFMDTYMNR